MHIEITPNDESAEKDLKEILQPLLDLLTTKYADEADFNGLDGFEVGGSHGFALWGNGDGCLVELPDRVAVYPLMARALATLLHRTGTSFGADVNYPTDEDPCRGPLRFSITKRLVWDNEFEAFLTGMHLLVDHFGFEAEAAERQIELLVKYLENEANLLELKAEDFAMF